MTCLIQRLGSRLIALMRMNYIPLVTTQQAQQVSSSGTSGCFTFWGSLGVAHTHPMQPGTALVTLKPQPTVLLCSRRFVCGATNAIHTVLIPAILLMSIMCMLHLLPLQGEPHVLQGGIATKCTTTLSLDCCAWVCRQHMEKAPAALEREGDLHKHALQNLCHDACRTTKTNVTLIHCMLCCCTVRWST